MFVLRGEDFRFADCCAFDLRESRRSICDLVLCIRACGLLGFCAPCPAAVAADLAVNRQQIVSKLADDERQRETLDDSLASTDRKDGQ